VETEVSVPGYSGTPLAKKLGIKPGTTVFFQNIPKDVLSELKTALADVKVTQQLRPEMDFIHGFVLSKSELKKEFLKWKKHLSKSGSIWVSWPKKSSGVETDLNDAVVRETGLSASLVDIKVCAVDEAWSGLKFVYRKADRK
jgi:hypothetical protein